MSEGLEKEAALSEAIQQLEAALAAAAPELAAARAELAELKSELSEVASLARNSPEQAAWITMVREKLEQSERVLDSGRKRFTKRLRP